MEQIITLKVDLEYPDEAHHAIDEAVKAYEEDKHKWTAQEIADAKRLAMHIMSQLCLDGYSINWANGDTSVCVFIYLPDCEPSNSYFIPDPDACEWNIWIAKCAALCRATGREVPEFITKKAGECW